MASSSSSTSRQLTPRWNHKAPSPGACSTALRSKRRASAKLPWSMAAFAWSQSEVVLAVCSAAGSDWGLVFSLGRDWAELLRADPTARRNDRYRRTQRRMRGFRKPIVVQRRKRTAGCTQATRRQRSEVELQGRLADARRICRSVGKRVVGRNLPEIGGCCRVEIVVWVLEFRPVEGVEHLPPDLESVALLEVEVLGEV